jgi:mannose-6-phosphate isomerase-like protein (cupin superfamily)
MEGQIGLDEGGCLYIPPGTHQRLREGPNKDYNPAYRT